MADVFDFDPSCGWDEREQHLIDHKIALLDVIDRCEREMGSADQAIGTTKRYREVSG